MLDALRRNASGWLIKILFVILAFSFVLWGIPQDFTGFGPASLATVGSTRISAEEFQRAYQNQLSAVARQSGQRLTPEQARLFGLDQNVLAQLVNAAALTNHAQKLGLTLSDAALAEGVRLDPDFHGADGKFSQVGFEGILRQNGMTEQGFLALRRKDELREQILGAVTNGIAPPKPLVDLLHAHREEARVIAHLTIDAAKAVTVPEPDEAKLKETYEQNKAKFMTPEYRQLAVLLMGLDQVRDRVPVPEEQVKTAYEQDQDTYNDPEKRRIQQIAFKDQAAALEAKKAIDGGKGFTEIAAAQGASLADTELGLLTRKQLIDPKIAEVAFSLPKDKVSDPVEGRFATVLLRVSEIQPGKQRTFEDVKDQVRERLFKEKAKAVIHELSDEVEDARLAGKTLKEIAEARKLRFIEAPATDRTNKTPDGKLGLDIGDANAVIINTAAFDATMGVETESVELTDGGYAWVDPVSVTAPKQKPFEEVKEDVKTLAVENERNRLLSEVGAKLVERVKAGGTLEALSKEYGGKPETTAPVTRTTVVQGLTEETMKQAFGLPKDGVGSAPSGDGKSRTVFKIIEVKPSGPPSKEQADRIADELRQDMRNDAAASYLDALKARQTVEVNQAAFRRATGAEVPQ